MGLTNLSLITKKDYWFVLTSEALSWYKVKKIELYFNPTVKPNGFSIPLG